MSNNDNKQKSNINIEIDEKIAEGTYSNLAIINHSVSEFVLDFICIMPGTPKNKVKSRIIITPQHAKRLSKALNDNIFRFEKKHGEIKENQQSVSEFVLDFICIMPGTPKNKVKSRIIITPQHAKRLSKALNDNIFRFEKKHGEIKENQQPPNVQLNFGQTGEA